MDLKSSIKAYGLELMTNKLEEESTSGYAGGYLTKAAFRKPKKQDKNSPTGFESSPKPNMYSKTMKFKIVDPKDRLNSKDLWKGKHINEIKVNTPSKRVKTPEGNEGLIIKKSTYQDSKDSIDKDIESSGYEGDKNNYIWYLVRLNNNKEEWWDEHELGGYNKDLNESRYTQFKRSTSKPKPREILHRAIKEIQMKLDEVNRLIEFTTRIKGELQENDQEIEYLKRTKDSLYKIQDKLKEAFSNISKINEIKINRPSRVIDFLNTSYKTWLDIKEGDRIITPSGETEEVEEVYFPKVRTKSGEYNLVRLNNQNKLKNLDK